MKKSDPLLEKIKAYNEAKAVVSSFDVLVRAIPSSLSRTEVRLPDYVPLVMAVKLKFCSGVTETSGSQSVSLAAFFLLLDEVLDFVAEDPFGCFWF